MAQLTVLLLLVVIAASSRASNIDIVNRMDRRFIPYSGLGKSSRPLRRYRYPIYNKRADPALDDLQPSGDGGSKRFLRGMSLRPLSLSLGAKAKRLRGVTPRYDISMTPYDLKTMAKLYRNGRRKRAPDVYDLRRIYRLLEAGRKRGVGADAAAAKRTDRLYDLLNIQRMASAGKRSPVVSYYDLVDIAKLNEAGKRAGFDYPPWDLANLEAAQKRSVDSLALLDLARMEAAGKRSAADRPLLPLMQMSGEDHFDEPPSSDRYSVYEPSMDQQDVVGYDVAASEASAKKKRSFSDVFGWDRKKKSVGDDSLANNYYETLKKEVSNGTEKRDMPDDVIMKKDDHGDED